ncbi:MAG TPA: hypothetical protein VMS76_01875 [Planctomycetota bacterium]|nr:hypothetical protein [Planctomycetota bacterium]
MLYRWEPYVPVARRRRQAAREMKKLAKKGHRAAPVMIEGRTIAHTFWGKAWCDNLERYSDFSNRLPRGRTYVRNGSVVDLALSPGKVAARVSGSRLYQVAIEVTPLAKARWKALCKDCAGAIDSVVELLQGRFARGVMQRLCHPRTGLFPAPAEIRFSCTCPDWASMCKHVAASLYGVGARLDQAPELFFALRQVDQGDLIAQAGHALALPHAGPAPDKVLGADGLSELFGLELGPAEPEPGPRARKSPKKPARKGRKQAKPSSSLTASRATRETKRRSQARRKKQ